MFNRNRNLFDLPIATCIIITSLTFCFFMLSLNILQFNSLILGFTLWFLQILMVIFIRNVHYSFYYTAMLNFKNIIRAWYTIFITDLFIMVFLCVIVAVICILYPDLYMYLWSFIYMDCVGVACYIKIPGLCVKFSRISRIRRSFNVVLPL